MSQTIENLYSVLLPLSQKVNGSVIWVHYCGVGDCGSADFEKMEDAKGAIVDQKSFEGLFEDVVTIESVWNVKKKTWDKITGLKKKNIIQISEEIAYEMLSLHTCGWEINAGSFGDLEVCFNPPLITLHHTPEEDEEDENGETITVTQDDEEYKYIPGTKPTLNKKRAVAKKKTAVKKTAVKKTAVKKTAVKKTAVKKTAVKKTAVKKTAVSAKRMSLPKNKSHK